MLQHGRKSQRSVMLSGVMDVNWPPQPPNNINAAAQKVWRETIKNLSADVLPRECYLLLAVWCCLKVELDEVMLALAQFSSVPTRPEDLKRYKVLINMRTALTRQFGQLSSRLRLTPTHRLDAHRSPSVGNRPWEDKQSRQLSSELKAQPQPWSASESEQEDPRPQQRPAQHVNGKPWDERAPQARRISNNEHTIIRCLRLAHVPQRPAAARHQPPPPNWLARRSLCPRPRPACQLLSARD